MPDALKIMESVNSFYTNAADSLNEMARNMIMLVGVAVPIVVTLLILLVQFLVFKRDQKAVKKRIKDKIKEAEKELNDNIEKKIAAEFKKSEEKLEKKILAARGIIFHAQGAQLLNDKRYSAAMESYFKAIEYLVPGGEERNLGRVLIGVKACFVWIKTRDLEEALGLGWKTQIEKGIEELRKINQNGRYTDDIEEIENFARKMEKL